MTTIDTEELDAGWGRRAKLGFIELSTSHAMTIEVPSALPPGVGALMARLRLPDGDASTAGLNEMMDSPALETALRDLADGGVSVVSFGCTIGSLLRGPGFDRELMSRMEAAAGVPASTTSTGLLAALDHLGARRVAVVTPYIDELNQLEVAFLEANGVAVTAIEGMGIRHDPDIIRVPHARTRELAHIAAQADDSADAVFISCTNLLTLASLDRLEAELGKPVISSVCVTVWHALLVAGVEPSATGVGSLLAGARGTGESVVAAQAASA
jgi:maleate isomerase